MRVQPHPHPSLHWPYRVTRLYLEAVLPWHALRTLHLTVTAQTFKAQQLNRSEEN